MSGRVIELTQVPPQAFFFIRSSRGKKNDNNAAGMVPESKEIIEERTARLPLFFFLNFCLKNISFILIRWRAFQWAAHGQRGG